MMDFFHDKYVSFFKTIISYLYSEEDILINATFNITRLVGKLSEFLRSRNIHDSLKIIELPKYDILFIFHRISVLLNRSSSLINETVYHPSPSYMD